MILASILAAALAAAPAKSARGPDWATTFGSDELAQALGMLNSVVVVPVGPAAKSAAPALEKAIRKGKYAQSVKDAPAIDDAEKLSDDQLVARVKDRAQRIAVLRVFPGGAGAPANATVAIYGPNGASFESLFGQAGRPMARSFRRSEDMVDAIATYKDRLEKKMVNRLVDIAQYVYVKNGVVVGDASYAPVMGLARNQISWSRFFKIVGRKDLAELQDAADGRRNLNYLFAGLSAVGGIAGSVLVFGMTGGLNSFGLAVPLSAGVLLAGGIGMMVFFAFGIVEGRPLMDLNRARDLAYEYNEKVLSGELKLAQRPPPPTLELRVSPAGLALTGTF